MTRDGSLGDEVLLAIAWVAAATAALASISRLAHAASTGHVLATTLLDGVATVLLALALRRYGGASLRPSALCVARTATHVRIELAARRLNGRARIGLSLATLSSGTWLLSPTTFARPDGWLLGLAAIAAAGSYATLAALRPLVEIDLDVRARSVASVLGVVALAPGARLRVVALAPSMEGHALVVGDAEPRPLAGGPRLAPMQLRRVAEAIARELDDVEIERAVH